MEELLPIRLSGAEQELISRPASVSDHYSILGLHVRLSGNDPEIISNFNALYNAFRVINPTADDDKSALPIRYHVTPARRLLVDAPGEQYVSDYPEILKWPSAILSRIFLRKLTSHWLVHAACVARDGKAIVIAGNSGMGKTTLSAHLADRGFDLLSDEFAPIHRTTLLVDPFPLRVGLREGPGRALLRGQEAIDLSFRSDAKKLVTTSSLSGRTGTESVPLHAVVFLTTKLTPSVTTIGNHSGITKAWFTGWSDALSADLSARAGAQILAVRPDVDLMEADLQIEDLISKTELLRQIARDNGVLLAEIKFEDMEPIDRTADSTCVAIPPTSGVLELIKKIPTFSRIAIASTHHNGKATGLIMDASAKLAGTSFYKMLPGRLDSSIAQIERIIS